MTYDEQMIERGQPKEMPPCRNCGHSWMAHSLVLYLACLTCNCSCYSATTAEDIAADENPETI